MSRDTQIAELLRKAAHAETLSEQTDLVRQAELLKSDAIEAKRAANEWRAEDAKIRDTLVPGYVHELHTASTDWLMDMKDEVDPKTASRAMVAEASIWFGRVSDEVKSYGDEYAEQARGLARRLAGQYGNYADQAERVFLDEADRLRTTAVRAGLIKNAEVEENDADGADATDDPMSSTASVSSRYEDQHSGLWDSLNKTAASTVPQVGQEGYPTSTAFPSQNGNLPPDATSSNRAPALQELADPNPSQDVVPVNDPGLSQQAEFPVSGTQKESKMKTANCPTCGGHGKVAVRESSLPSIGDIAKFAASGLDQIEQIADPKDNPKPANQLQQGYGVDVAFPWIMNPQQVPAAISQAEQQVADRNAKSPLLKGAGRDNSGWIGDMGARGIDYPGEQAPTGDQSSSVGYTDPVYGNGGDQGNQQLLPYGHAEEQDRTNAPDQWQYGQPTQADQGWREAVASNPALAQAIAYVNQHLSAYNRTNG